jgi:hypothetical protein
MSILQEVESIGLIITHKRKVGGLSFLDPKVTLNVILCKWIFVPFELGESTFKILLKYCLSKVRPCCK